MSAEQSLGTRDGQGSALTVAGFLLTSLAVGMALVWPYWDASRHAPRELDRYWPPDRSWGLQVNLDASGRAVEWTGYSQSELPVVQALTTLNADTVQALSDLGVKDARGAAGVRIQRLAARIVQKEGGSRNVLVYTARTPDGHFYLADRDLAAAETYVYRPPLRVMPAQPRPGARWTQQGKINRQLDYRLQGAIERATPDASYGRSDCLRVQRKLILSSQGTTLDSSSTTELYCAHEGYMAGETRNARGLKRTVEYGRAGHRAGWLPPAAPVAPDPAPTRVSAALPTTFTLLGRVTPHARERVSEAPTLLRSPSGLLAVVTNTSETVTALQVSGDAGRVAWRFMPGGSVTGGVVVDERRGRVYFGSSARQLYALDVQGLPLWSVKLRDHMAARPLVTADAIIAVSEDGSVLSVDASGKVRWTADLGALSRATPVLAGSLLVFANNNGSVLALRARDGQAVWRTELGAPITAPLQVNGESVIAASTSGEVARLQLRSGQPVWQATAGRGGSIRHTPAIGGEEVLVNADGELVTLDFKSGAVVARASGGYVGAPLMVDQTVHAATKNELQRLTTDLRVLDRTPAPGEHTRFVTGATRAADALLLGDAQGGLWRSGPTQPGVLQAAWQGTTRASRAGLPAIISPPVVLPERTVLLDSEGGVYRVDETGAFHDVAQLDLRGFGLTARPGSDGRSLIALSNREQLQLLDVTRGQIRWSVDVGGVLLQTPIFTKDTVIVVSTAPEVVALDLQTGKTRWRRALKNSLMGAPHTDGRTVWISSPVMALDAMTGEPIWTSEAATFGASELDVQDKVMYVRSIQNNRPWLNALDLRSGRVLWQKALPANATTPLEPLGLTRQSVVVPTGGRELIALDRTSGQVRWKHDGSSLRWGSLSAQEDRVAYLGTDGHVTLIGDTDGAVLARWRAAESEMKEETYRLARPVFTPGGLLVPHGLELVKLEESSTSTGSRP